MIKKLAIPVIRECPIIIVFFIFIRSSVIGLFDIYIIDLWFEKLVTFSLWFLYAYFIAAMICVVNRSWFRWLWYVLLFVVFAVAFFIGTIFEMKISPTLFTLILETNSRESSEFLDTYVFSKNAIGVYIKLFAYISIAVIIEYLYRRYFITRLYSIRVKTGLYIVSYATLCILCLGIYGCCRIIEFFRPNTINATDLLEFPADDIYTRLFCSLYISYSSTDEIEKAVEVSLHSANATTTTYEVSDSLKIIFVIGESFNKMHSDLYGYPLHTTPNLQKQKERGNLYVFKDVITPYNYTSMTIKNMMSCNSLIDSEKWYDYPFFPILFRKAGYEVHFWDNQRDMCGGSNFQYAVNSYLYNDKLARAVYSKNNTENYMYDGELIDDYRHSYDKTECSFVMFHLLGQHVGYLDRFPNISRFVKFTTRDMHRAESYLDTAKLQVIANYDNATYYNDYVVSQIIDLFSQDNAVLVYLSDHGEEVFDYRDYCGRSYTEAVSPQFLKYQFDIPFIIWCSDKYKQKNPEIVRAIQESVEKPFMIDNVCQLFFHLGGLQTEYYHPERDLLSHDYLSRERLIRGGTVNYDQVMNSQLKAQSSDNIVP